MGKIKTAVRCSRRRLAHINQGARQLSRTGFRLGLLALLLAVGWDNGQVNHGVLIRSHAANKKTRL
jgi:hypothetical protein